MIITLCNGKGGVGKSTTSVLLTLLFEKAGLNVGLMDRDPQGTSTYWLQQLGKEQADPEKAYDYMIIDTPPQLSSPLFTESIRQAHKVIIVCSPSPTDLWTTKDTLATIDSIKKKDTERFLLFNKVKANTTLGKGVDDLAEKIGLEKIPHVLHDRQSYQHASIFGIDRLNNESLQELTAVGKAILGIEN